MLDHVPLDLADSDGAPTQLTVADVVAVARRRRRVLPLGAGPEAGGRALESAMRDSADWVAGEVASSARSDPRAIYGINTGFGALAGRRTFPSPQLARVLSHNLVASHSAGVGAPLAEDVVRAAALIRARQLANGVSGIRIEVVNRLIGVLNADIYPDIPCYGSLGASGDLAPLAHLALVISEPLDDDPSDEAPADAGTYGGGWVWVADEGRERGIPHGGDSLHQDFSRGLQVQPDPATGRLRVLGRVPASEVMALAGGPIALGAKEGLALSNGATFSAAILALAVNDAHNLLDHLELAAAMSLEAIRGFRDAFLPEVHAARPHPGAAGCASTILRYVDGSTLLDPASSDTDPVRVPPQDPYSVRCAPQVLGAARQTVNNAQSVVDIEMNAAVDNPLIFGELPRAYKAVSCGNFHGAPIGYALDFLKIVMTDAASQSERRTFKLMDYRVDGPDGASIGLPPFLVATDDRLVGLNSGLMIAQYTAAGLVSAAKTLAHPDSVDSIPSSANQEDHVSMSMNAGLNALHVLRNVASVVAIELLCSAQAVDLRRAQGNPGRGVGAAHRVLRSRVGFLASDRVLSDDLDSVTQLVHSGELVAAAREAAGS